MKDCDGLLMRTPAYHPLESPLHYVLRLSEANGYYTPSIVMQLVTHGEDERVLARWDHTHLNAVLPTCRHLPAAFTYRWPGSRYKCDLSLLGKQILSRHLNAPHAGICPECVRELGYTPAWWDIKYVMACPIHHRMLLHACPSCGTRLSHLRRGLLVCSCGAPLTGSSNDEPSTPLLWLMELLRRKATAIQEANAVGPLRHLKPEDLSLNALCRVIETVGRTASRMSDTSEARWSFEARCKCLPHVALFLYSWPKGVPAFCARWDTYVRSTSAKYRSFRHTFSWAYNGFFSNLGSRRSELLFVMDALLRYEQTHEGKAPIDVRSGDLKQFTRAHGTYCKLSQAAKLSGIPYHTLLRLVRKKHVPFRTSQRAGRPEYEIKTEVARSLRLGYHDMLTIRLASRFIGVTHNLYMDLRQCGVIQKTHKTMLPRGMAICDLEKFRQSVLAKARKRTNAQSLKSLDTLRRNKCPRTAMVRVLKGILDGSVPCFRSQATLRRINELRVRPSDVDPIIAACTPPKSVTITQLQARYRLSVHEAQTLARYLVHRLNAKERMSSSHLNEEKFDEFMSRYQGLTAYAQARGTTYRVMLARLRRARVALFAIPAFHPRGHYVYFFPKTATSSK